jgi:ketosteroid isomerase-like protein
MSQENVEIVRRCFEVWNAGDMEALRELYDPGIIWRPPEGWPEPGPYAGREAVMRQLEQMRSTWDNDRFQLISDLAEVGDRVAVRFIWQGAGRGPESNIEGTGVYTVRKKKVVAIEFFWDHAEALDALGLSEQAMPQEPGR